MLIKIPSKTFAIGEYGVLKNGSAIVLTCNPYFQWEVQKGSHQGLPESIHSESIAGKLYKRISEKYKGLSLSFTDPYKDFGGMGRSSAEFLGLYALAYGVPFERIRALQVFRDLGGEANRRPSGVDMIAQSIGGVAVIDLSKNRWVSKTWVFNDIGFFIIPTGEKIITHFHLETLKDEAFTDLIEISQRSLQSYERLDVKGFVQTLRDYHAVMGEKGLLSKTSQKLCLELEKIPSVLVAKGCGAMGGDMVLVLFYNEDRDSLRSYITNKLEKPIVTMDGHIGRGMHQENGVLRAEL